MERFSSSVLWDGHNLTVCEECIVWKKQQLLVWVLNWQFSLKFTLSEKREKCWALLLIRQSLTKVGILGQLRRRKKALSSWASSQRELRAMTLEDKLFLLHYLASSQCIFLRSIFRYNIKTLLQSMELVSTYQAFE